jgi:hypothetical protein
LNLWDLGKEVAFAKVLVGSGFVSSEEKINRDYWRVFLFYLMVESADLKTSLHCSSSSENIILNSFKKYNNQGSY